MIHVQAHVRRKQPAWAGVSFGGKHRVLHLTLVPHACCPVVIPSTSFHDCYGSMPSSDDEILDLIDDDDDRVGCPSTPVLQVSSDLECDETGLAHSTTVAPTAPTATPARKPLLPSLFEYSDSDEESPLVAHHRVSTDSRSSNDSDEEALLTPSAITIRLGPRATPTQKRSFAVSQPRPSSAQLTTLPHFKQRLPVGNKLRSEEMPSHSCPVPSSALASSAQNEVPPQEHFVDLVSSVKQEPDTIDQQDLQEILNTNEHCSEAKAEKETPPEMRVMLLKHQRQALAWMVEREEPNKPPGHPRGGILADDQGFGKTLSTIALMMHNKPPETEQTHGASNLVVTPTSVLHQWAAEIRERIEPEFRPRILVYHGLNRQKFATVLHLFDVVITSYGVLSAEFPKVLQRDEKRNPIIHRAPGPLYQLKWYRVILDEAQAIKNFRSERFRAAMDLKTIHKWSLTGTPIQNTLDDIYSQFLFLEYHVVEGYREWKLRFKNPLEGAFRIGNRRRDVLFKKFQTMLGVVLLRRAKSDKINGKPIIQLPRRTVTVRELKFTRTEQEYYQGVELWTVHRMNNADYMENQFAFTYVVLLRLRQACNHPALCEWESGNKFKFSDEELDVVDIRMTTKCLFKKLPSEVQERLYIALGPDATSEHAQQCPICMDVITADGTVTKCGHIFCTSDFEKWISSNDTCPSCRGTLSSEDDYMSLDDVRKEVHALERRKRRENQKESEEEDIKPKVEDKEEIKLVFSGKRPGEESVDIEPDFKKARTDDDGCSVSLSSSLEGKQDWEASSDEDEIQSGKNMKNDGSSRSTKIKAFMEDYRKLMKTTNDKVLCYSQWTRMLDLVEIALNEEGYEFVRLDGTMSLDARQAAIQMFKRRSKCRLFLISLNAGSTGLNLTNANHVFLLDSWWNPAVEDQVRFAKVANKSAIPKDDCFLTMMFVCSMCLCAQAIDRVHRIGQTKEVTVTKYKIENTVEDKILQIQDRKRQIIDGALGVEGLKTMGRRRLTMRDLMWMFSDVAQNVAQRAMLENNESTAAMANDVLDFARSFN